MSNTPPEPRPTAALPEHSELDPETRSHPQNAPDHRERRIGEYYLLEQIGEGGMGAVYRAEQRQPLKRTVALKLIKLGMDSRQVIARFESERQALAMMNHPNVARVLDAGTSDSGRPYFVMEYVPGEPITTFCDRHHYTTRQRLELFCQACQAVQHAHQKAIIHRDIKPSNVLVMLQDGATATVKVIDFGVAKATAQKLTEMTLFTETGQLVGTREYMSPEQAEMSTLDIDTRTDVYSLGVLLYELLAGALPFDSQSLRLAGYAEMQRIIREVEPPRPSTRLSRLGPGAADVAQKRQTQIEQLEKELRSELEWIPLKAMRKDRAHRYTTPNELAQDIENYLQQKPLIAAPESAAYRLRKFVRRNKGAVSAVAAVLVVLIGGIIGTTVGLVGQARQRRIAERTTDEALRQERRANEQAQRADQEARNAKEQAVKVGAVNSFLADMLGAADPDRMLGDKVTVLQATQEAVRKLDAGALKDQPWIESDVRLTIGMTLMSLARYDEAEAVLRKALTIDREIRPAGDVQIAYDLHQLGQLALFQGKLTEAERLLREALELRRKALPAGDSSIADSLEQVGSCCQELGRPAEAEPLFREAMEIRRAARPPNGKLLGNVLNKFALLLARQGKLADAEPLLREALECHRTGLPPGHPYIGQTVGNLGYVLKQQGKFAEAEALFLESLENQRRTLPPDHPLIATALNSLALVKQSQGKLAEAEPLLREALAILSKTLPAGHTNLATAMNNLAGNLQDQGKLAEAEPLIREALKIDREGLPPTHPSIAAALNSLSLLLLEQRKFAEAELHAREALDIWRRALPPGHPTIAIGLSNFASILVEQGKYIEAEKVEREALDMSRASLPPGHPDIGLKLSELGNVLTHLGRLDEAEKFMREALDLYSKALPDAHPYAAATLYNLAMVSLHQGKVEQAEQLLRESLQMRRTVLPPGHPDIAFTVTSLADVLGRLNREEDAVALRREYGLPSPTTPATTLTTAPAAEPSATP